MKYVDTHAHYIHRFFNQDREFLIRQILRNDVHAIIECGTDTRTNKYAVDLATRFNDVYAVVGYFPTSVTELDEMRNLESFKDILKNPKVVGLGEIGFDFYHDKTKDRSGIQKLYFEYQLKMAKEFNLPVCIHSRDAEKATMDVLRKFGPYRGVIHCYAYGPENVKELVDLGYYFGIGGTSTYYKNQSLREAIKEMPLNRILLETDAPFLSPEPVRRDRNDSSNISYVIKEIAKLKGVSEDIVIKRTNQNVTDLYGIKIGG